jgi:type IV pilus assembly protein PilZ
MHDEEAITLEEVPESTPPTSSERRIHDRVAVSWAVDCATDDTFLFAYIANISEMGIFVRTSDPLAVGTPMLLGFAPPACDPFSLRGVVAWVNPMRADGDNINPGMGVRFVDLTLEDRERIVGVIRTIAYVRKPD